MRSRSSSYGGAKDILSESYEWGELTRERYMQMKENFKKVRRIENFGDMAYSRTTFLNVLDPNMYAGKSRESP